MKKLTPLLLTTVLLLAGCSSDPDCTATDMEYVCVPVLEPRYINVVGVGLILFEICVENCHCSG